MLESPEFQSLVKAARQRVDGEGRRRAGTQPDDHAVLDEFHRRLSRGSLQSIPIRGGRCRAHGRAIAAAALARISAMAAA